MLLLLVQQTQRPSMQNQLMTTSDDCKLGMPYITANNRIGKCSGLYTESILKQSFRTNSTKSMCFILWQQ